MVNTTHDPKKLVFVKNPQQQLGVEGAQRIEPSTCSEAETIVLQVLDDSMEPEFKKRCMIVIDPTGHPTDGSYVFAHRAAGWSSRASTSDSPGSVDAEQMQPEDLVAQYHFRQLRRAADGSWLLCALNDAYASEVTCSDLSEIVGVVVQRAGTRRAYHKRYV